MDQRTWKLMTFHPTDDVDRLYVSRKEEGRGLSSIEDSTDALNQRLEDDMRWRGESLIAATQKKTGDTKINGTNIASKQKWEGEKWSNI